MLNLVTLLSIVLSLTQSAQQSDSLEREHVAGLLGARLDSQLTRFAAYGFSGTVLVVRDSQIVLLKGYGLADVERGVPNRATTRFEMNSMTKMFTGVAILQLAGQGRLRLGDPVERYLGAFPAGKQGATIEQLATHTSGLIVEGSELAGESRASFLRDVKRTPRESAPGEKYRYTNAGFSLLAAIIETVTGEKYEEYLRRHEFAPAGMQTALFRDEIPTNDSRFAHGYVGTPDALRPGPPNPYVWGTRGAGGVWATVGDMYRWLGAIEGRRLLPEVQQQILMTAPRPPAEEAFGWHVETTADGRPRIQKGGGSDDFASHIQYYPRDRVVIVWATNNLRQRWRQTLNQVLPAILFANNTILLPQVASVARTALEELQGKYISRADTIELRVGAGYLYAAPNRLQVPTNVMFFPQDDVHFTAFDPASRTVTRLEFNGSGRRALVIEVADGRRISLQR